MFYRVNCFAPENAVIIVKISLPSYIQAEIYDISYVLPVNFGHMLPVTPTSEIEAQPRFEIWGDYSPLRARSASL